MSGFPEFHTEQSNKVLGICRKKVMKQSMPLKLGRENLNTKTTSETLKSDAAEMLLVTPLEALPSVA